MKNNYDCIIIGGGAAGLTAAYTAAKRGKSVLLFERNCRVGKKLAITGKGRCNVTNNCTDEEFFANIPVGGKFLYSAYSNFNCRDCMGFFENLGVPLKTERGNRVFPVSDRAGDIVSALENACTESGVNIVHKRVSEVLAEDGAVVGVRCGETVWHAVSVLIATGGKSYPVTGSDGDGYKFAAALGHTVTPLKPSLVPLVSEEEYCSEMTGLSLKNVLVTVIDGKKNKPIFKEQGEMLFTHFGASGPLILSASSHIRDMERGRYKILIDMKPALDEQALDKRIQRDFSENPNRIFGNSLSKLLPSKMIPVVVKLSGISADKQVNSVTKQERANLVKLLKNFPVTVRDFRPLSEAIITSGGVKLSEVNPKTMGSKLVRGLFFAGEVLDIDAYTGGFNLQIAFSTAVSAGNSL
ncbi:MAG: NAD(P)/FAD-dependent oxidoreductase [Ruminococcus sp.]|nr:NAD(P)/FAD-dependent oxidoreductase [Ruminococcus sp.]MCM1381786.1 NAD(P)/FAD-dependent oxidoreductase [Muribaculaceae bacterium]MCM1479453.1 NAD(P)/FAD-dependent oxidoreductase [Muribaculaceae bacterium]